MYALIIGGLWTYVSHVSHAMRRHCRLELAAMDCDMKAVWSDIWVRRHLETMSAGRILKVLLERDDDYDTDKLLFIDVFVQSLYLSGKTMQRERVICLLFSILRNMSGDWNISSINDWSDMLSYCISLTLDDNRTLCDFNVPSACRNVKC